MRILITTLLLLIALPLAAGEKTGPKKLTGIPACRQDRAFNQFVDLTYLGQAWQELSPSKLADCGLQLAEGERVLLREHSAISAERVLGYAIQLAGQQGDGPTLARLAKAPVVTRNAELAQQLQAARKQVAGSELAPTADPQSAAETLYQAVLQDIREVKLTSSPKAAEVLRKIVPTLPVLSQGQKQTLLRELDAKLPAADESTVFATHSLRYCQLAWQHERGDQQPHFLRTMGVLRQLTTTGKGPALRQAREAMETILTDCEIGVNC
jgi:hypothetical protein